jgi:hypothetical protein
MNALVLEGIAFVAVVLSLGLAALVVTFAMKAHTAAPAPELSAPDPGGAAETISRVLGEIERLAALRDRGVLTAKEFATQKSKLLESQDS